MTLRFSSEGLFFTADTHFFHKLVIGYTGRPCIDVFDMNDMLIRNWNSVVKPGDTVFHLGDVSFGKHKDTVSILNQLNGKVHLIVGNHDKQFSAEARTFFRSVQPLLEIDVVEPGGTVQRITLCHYAMRVWNRHHYGAWQLHGHSHGNLAPIGRQLDVGVDCHAMTPILYAQVKALIMERAIHSVDHHIAAP